jgi:exonuclease III
MKEHLDILLLQETKCTREESSQILRKCWKQANLVEVDAKGVEGGMVVLWNLVTVLLDDFFPSNWTITASFHLIGSNKHDFVRSVYRPTRPRDKEAFLHHLEWISNQIDTQPWIPGGDFNMIIGLEEKKGGTCMLGNDSKHFHQTIDILNIINVEIDNHPFTWSNRCSRTHHVSSRLDHFLISESIMLDGLAWNATVIDTPGSDHWPILLSININGTPSKKPFLFEKFWLTHPDFQANIKL